MCTLLPLPFPLSSQRSGNRIQSVLPLTAAMIYNATHTGDNEFELDGVPLGQVGRGWGEGWDGLCGVWGSWEVRVRRVEVMVGQ